MFGYSYLTSGPILWPTTAPRFELGYYGGSLQQSEELHIKFDLAADQIGNLINSNATGVVFDIRHEAAVAFLTLLKKVEHEEMAISATVRRYKIGDIMCFESDLAEETSCSFGL